MSRLNLEEVELMCSNCNPYNIYILFSTRYFPKVKTIIPNSIVDNIYLLGTKERYSRIQEKNILLVAVMEFLRKYRKRKKNVYTERDSDELRILRIKCCIVNYNQEGMNETASIQVLSNILKLLKGA